MAKCLRYRQSKIVRNDTRRFNLKQLEFCETQPFCSLFRSFFWRTILSNKTHQLLLLPVYPSCIISSYFISLFGFIQKVLNPIPIKLNQYQYQYQDQYQYQGAVNNLFRRNPILFPFQSIHMSQIKQSYYQSNQSTPFQKIHIRENCHTVVVVIPSNQSKQNVAILLGMPYSYSSFFWSFTTKTIDRTEGLFGCALTRTF